MKTVKRDGDGFAESMPLSSQRASVAAYAARDDTFAGHRLVREITIAAPTSVLDRPASGG
ncbi:MAG TPA: hypothetical protein VL383_14475 [Gemmatimonadaceae bacterium]|nr:hypothetical protein [Gemmatimonadaceae bacterium]